MEQCANGTEKLNLPFGVPEIDLQISGGLKLGTLHEISGGPHFAHDAAAISLKDTPSGRIVTVSGFVLVRQKPGSAKGTMFMTIEDETEFSNLVIWPKLFEQERRLLLSSRLITCVGKLQKGGQVIHVIADTFRDDDKLLRFVALSHQKEQPDLSDNLKTDKLDFGLRNFC